MNRARGTRGTSLTEVLVSLLFAGFVAAILCQFGASMRRGVRVLEVASKAQEDVWAGIEFMQRDLRSARFSPTGTLAGGVWQAKEAAIQAASDFDGDGTTNGPNEVVAYSLNATTHTLMRGLGNAPPQPVIDHVAPDGLRFAYYDAGGNRISLPSAGLNGADRARIRRIDIQLATEIPHPDPFNPDPIVRAGTASVFLRNGS